ncbi:hypothetical protein Asp14428_55370 [Actinoplanes sp. NBRC 14428]|uniref:Lipoprotein n=1 Tax=Pseudosporangium ferrugineum TaxID=439699 RepID=A0A2T0S4G5_9ACTN|nr:hypothetical protein [Pseudosporangium ferrugineum]PRY28309.1 hypothetical protein CLV70_108101 [Pseudosporangium ferrugineum]BCJ54062.1 hypothetical protein Asp14428_55370 [Actinoplanes sp. NBRC 14428]
MNRRLAAVLVPLLAFSLAACSGDDEQPADPKAALAASTSGIKAGNYSFTAAMPGGSTGKGVVHVPSRSASLDLDMVDEENKGKVQFRIADADRFVKLTMDMGQSKEQLESLSALGDDPQNAKLVEGMRAMIDLFSGKHWLRTDMSKLKSKDLQFSIDNPDISGVGTLFDGVVTAQRSGSVITGTLDVTKVGDDTQLFSKSTFEGADATQAKAVPYEATLDGEGRLTKLVLDLPKTKDAPAGKGTVEISGYGAATKQEPPAAAEVKEMPESAYEMLNSED